MMPGPPPAPGDPPRGSSEELLAEAFAEAARTITVEDCVAVVHEAALAQIGNWGFSDMPDVSRRYATGVRRTICNHIEWMGAEGVLRKIYPELVTQLQVRADQGLEYSGRGWPENKGASLLQMEVIRGFDKILTAHSVHRLAGEEYTCTGHGDGRWLRTFHSDDTKVVRILVHKDKFMDNDLVHAELYFWDGFPGSALAKPV